MLIALIVFLLSRVRRRPARPPGPQPNPRAEAVALLLFALVPLGALVFVVVYFTNADTQLLGLAIGGALVVLAAAIAVTAVKVVPQTEHVEPRPELDRDIEAEDALALYEQPAEGVSRRR